MFRAGVFVAMGSLALTGCVSTPQADRLLDNIPPQLAQPVELTRVAFFPQRDLQCGPAALATLLVSSGIEITPDELSPQVYIPKREGSLQIEMLAATRRYKRVPYRLDPKLPDILTEVAAGNPVLVLQNLGLKAYPLWHYAVVVGYDLYKNSIVLRSGRQKRRTYSLQKFERSWQLAGYWAFVAQAPDRLPATAQALPFIKSINVFDSLGDYELTAQAYAAAAAAWPLHATVLVAAGNNAYHRKQLQAAESYYRQALHADPDYAPALNNLAQTLLDEGRAAQALPYIERALQQQDEHKDTYRQTYQAVHDALPMQQ